MKKSRLILNACAIAFLSINAHAGLHAIATTNMESKDDPAIACTLLDTDGPTYNGGKVLIVFSEANEGNSNPTILVQDLAGRNSWQNDDWTGARTLNGAPLGGSASDLANVYRAGVGRSPGQSTDAAILVSFPPGTAVCMYSREVSTNNLKRVSMAMTDITPVLLKSTGGENADSLKKFLSTAQ
ncbi:MAG: hypothetical protein ACTS5V_01265 [Giesbergeria sp.]